MTRQSNDLGQGSPLDRAERKIRDYRVGKVLVAFSGGVDSAVVMAVAARVLGPASVTAVTAVSPSYPAGELTAARSVAAAVGVRHLVVHTDEVTKEAYARNDVNRCFHCKLELYATLDRLRAQASTTGAIVLAGANADDAADFRPGGRAAEIKGVLNPLLDAGLTKADVREAARELGLAVADKPALACLSSRVAYGIRVTAELLERIDEAERALKALGFDSVRVRHFGAVAKIELPVSDLARLIGDSRLPGLVADLRKLGWTHITLDLEGQRSGSMNAGVVDRIEGPPKRLRSTPLSQPARFPARRPR